MLFGTIDTWLTWKLTGGKVHVTDYSNASRTMLFNIHDLKWDKEILELLNIPEALLPEVKEILKFIVKLQHITSLVVKFLFPVWLVTNNLLYSVIGFRKWNSQEYLWYRFIYAAMNTGNKPVLSKNNLLTTIGYSIDGKINFALEGSVFVSGSALQWLRDSMEIIESAPESERAANESTNHNEVYVVPAFTGLGAPYWDSDARGAVFGLTRGTTKNDFIKATLQSLAYQTRDVLDTMEKDTGIKIPVLRVDGGAAMNNYLLQFQSDLLNKSVEENWKLRNNSSRCSFLSWIGSWFLERHR